MRRRLLSNETINLSLDRYEDSISASGGYINFMIYNNGKPFTGANASDFSFSATSGVTEVTYVEYNVNDTEILVGIEANENNYARNLDIRITYKNKETLYVYITQSADSISYTYTSTRYNTNSCTPISVDLQFDTPTVNPNCKSHLVNSLINTTNVSNCEDQVRVSCPNALITDRCNANILYKCSIQKETETIAHYESGKEEIINTDTQYYNDIYFNTEGLVLTNSKLWVKQGEPTRALALARGHQSFKPNSFYYDSGCTQVISDIEMDKISSFVVGCYYDYRCSGGNPPLTFSVYNNSYSSTDYSLSSLPQYDANNYKFNTIYF